MTKIVGSATVSRAEMEAEIQTAMTGIWQFLAKVVSVVVSRAVLDLDADLKKGKVNKSELALRTAANTAKTINGCGLLPPNRKIEVAGLQQMVWKEIFPQGEFPQSSQASSTQNILNISSSIQ